MAIVSLFAAQFATALGQLTKTQDPAKQDVAASSEQLVSAAGVNSSTSAQDNQQTAKSSRLAGTERSGGLETTTVRLAGNSDKAKQKNSLLDASTASALWRSNLGLTNREPQGDTAGAGQQPQSSAADAQELAKKLNNPVASLISLPFQSNFDFRMGTGSGWRYTLNVQPVIPIALNPKWNLISRTIIPIIHQGNVSGPHASQSGLGDTVQSLFFSPNKTEPFIWAVGPVFLVPTATNAHLGSKQFGMGFTALVLKQKSGWTYGVLMNHIWRVAGSTTRARVDATFVQPFLTYTTKDAWSYSINTESTYDWTGNHWAVPIHPTVSKLVRFGKQPVSFAGGLRCWVTTPNGGPKGCGMRFVITPLFPRK